MIYSQNSLNPYIRQIKRYTSKGMPMGYIDPDHSFTLIVEGGGTFVLEGVEYQVRRGDLLFFPPYLHHLIKPVKSVEQLIVHFDPFYNPDRESRSVYLNQKFDNLSDFLANEANTFEKKMAESSYLTTLPDSLFKTIKERWESALQINHENPELAQIYLKSLVTELIFHLLNLPAQTPERKSFDTKKWEKLDETVSFIHKNYSRNISLEEAASVTGVTRTYFSRLFKEYMGVNFHHYLMGIRIERSKALINEADLNFTEIADVTGFANIHHFSKVFKKFEGCSPSAYKKSV